MLLRRTIGLALAGLVIATTAGAQARSGTSGFSLNFGVNGTSLDVDEFDENRQSGLGLHVGIGFGFTSKFAIFLDGAGSSIDSDGGNFILTHGDLGVRYHFANPNKAFIPYLEAALSGRTASPEDEVIVDDDGNEQEVDIEISGGGFTLGGGILYFFNRKWALNAHLKWTTGEFSRVRVENVSVDGFEIDATSTRIGIGLSWFPRGS